MKLALKLLLKVTQKVEAGTLMELATKRVQPGEELESTEDSGR